MQIMLIIFKLSLTWAYLEAPSLNYAKCDAGNQEVMLPKSGCYLLLVSCKRAALMRSNKYSGIYLKAGETSHMMEHYI
jgi:hypothetical protein